MTDRNRRRDRTIRFRGKLAHVRWYARQGNKVLRRERGWLEEWS